MDFNTRKEIEQKCCRTVVFSCCCWTAVTGGISYCLFLTKKKNKNHQSTGVSQDPPLTCITQLVWEALWERGNEEKKEQKNIKETSWERERDRDREREREEQKKVREAQQRGKYLERIKGEEQIRIIGVGQRKIIQDTVHSSVNVLLLLIRLPFNSSMFFLTLLLYIHLLHELVCRKKNHTI